MRILIVSVVLALTVTDVSGGSWWRRVKRGGGRLWREYKGPLITAGLGLLLGRRSIEDVDQNGDGVLTKSELQQHMEERDVEHLLETDENGDGQITRDEIERYAQNALATSQGD